jgi:peptidoglycan/LPS O-acetylase OafA/YrhL
VQQASERNVRPAASVRLHARRTLGAAFSTRHNSLNFLRLVLAAMVIVSHAILLGGYADEQFQNTALSTIALYGFFGISGYLIAGSASRNGLGRYLWQRFLRILPGYWVCLVVTAFFFGLIGWTFSHPAASHGTASYVGASDGPFQFVLHNSLLKVNQQMIAGTPRAVPFPLAWNGPLWSLFYEAVCYLVLAGLAASGLLRKRRVVAGLTLALWLLEAGVSLSLNTQLHSLSGTVYMVGHLLVFVPLFLSGSLLYLYRDRVPDSGVVALASTAVFILSIWWPVGGTLNRFTGQIAGSAVMAGAVVYPLLWLGVHLPFEKVGAKNDYSYGLYIYAWPVQQLLAIWGVQRLGYVAYTLLGLLATIPFAVMSWWLVERHALALKRIEAPAALQRLRRRKGGLLDLDP